MTTQESIQTSILETYQFGLLMADDGDESESNSEPEYDIDQQLQEESSLGII